MSEVSRPATIEDLESVETKLKSTYTGRPGCMCGCNGKYTEPKILEDGSKKLTRANKMMITRFRKAIEAGEAGEQVIFNSWKCVGGLTEACLYIETETRNNVLYLEAC